MGIGAVILIVNAAASTLTNQELKECLRAVVGKGE